MKSQLLPLLLALLLATSGRLVSTAFAAPPDRTPGELRASIEKRNSFIADPEERARKYQEMCKTPFTFYRATAHLFYEDILSDRIKVPDTWNSRRDLRTWISGDFHFQNAGIEAPNEPLRFELNDFDESCLAPFSWDLIRLAASVYLVKDSKDWTVDKEEKLDFMLTDNEADKVVLGFLKRYRGSVESNAVPALSAKEMAEPTDAAKPKTGNSFVRGRLNLDPAKRAKKIEKFWGKETEEGAAKKKFKLSDKGRFAAVPESDVKILDEQWDRYVLSLDPSFVRKAGPNYFKIIDRARRLGSGLGSLGVRKIYLLIEGPTDAADDNIVLEAKECVLPAPIEAGLPHGEGTLDAQGKRVSDAVRAMVANPDPHEGWFNVGRFSYHVTQIAPLADDFKLEDFKTPADFVEYIDWIATALANAHCRANSRFAPAALEVLTPEMLGEIQKLARQYAEQVLADHKAFCDKK